MALTTVTIEGSPTTTFRTFRKMLTRASDGRLWACFCNSANTRVQVRYSDDDGATWSSAIDAITTPGTDPDAWIMMDLDDLPVVFCFDSTGAFDVGRYNGNDGAPAFTQTSATWLTATQIRISNASCITSTGRWYVFYVLYSQVQPVLYCRYSDDDCATWSAEQTVYTGDNSGAFGGVNRGGWNDTVSVICDRNDVVHITYGDFLNANPGSHALLYFSMSGTSPSFPLTATTVYQHSYNSRAQERNFFCNSIAIDDFGDLHVAYSTTAEVASTANHPYYVKRTNGTWGSPVALSTAGSISFDTSIWIDANGMPNVIVLYQGLGTSTTSRDAIHWKAQNRGGSAWDAAVKLENTTDIPWGLGIAAEYTAGLAFTQLASGLAYIEWDSTNADVEFWYESPVWKTNPVAVTGSRLGSMMFA